MGGTKMADIQNVGFSRQISNYSNSKPCCKQQEPCCDSVFDPKNTLNNRIQNPVEPRSLNITG